MFAIVDNEFGDRNRNSEFNANVGAKVVVVACLSNGAMV